VPDSAARLDRWKLSLLDLTLRNRLLDAKDGARVLTLRGADPIALYAALDAGTTLVLEPQANVEVDADELDRRLVAMARSAREALQESGASTLWVALGLLRWFEAGSDVARHAPLALYPVKLERARAGERYRVVAQVDEEPRWNETLFEKLRAEHGLVVPHPDVDGELDLAALLTALGAAIAPIARWAIVPECRLGIFTFSKFVMWTDLDARGEALIAAPVVAHLAAGDGTAFPSAGEFPIAHDLDRTLALGDLYAPLDCDSSQLAAVLAAAAGKSFVLQGPPGTGKSQTITNLIAQALVAGKTVLFVAEKQAALDVVQRRLTAAGLGDFCLELHSHKARKREVIAELGRVLERVWRPNTPVTGDDDRLAEVRDELNAYVHALHAPGAAGESVHDALAELGQLRDVPKLASGATATTPAAVAAQREAVRRYAEAAIAVAPVTAHPWHGSTLDAWQVTSADAVQAALADAAAAGRALAAAVTALDGAVPGLAPRTRAQLDAVGMMAAQLATSPRPGAALVEAAGTVAPTGAVAESIALVKARAGELTPKDVGGWLALVRRRRTAAAAVDPRWSPTIYAVVTPELLARFRAWADRFPLWRWFALRGARATVRKALASGALPDDDTIATDLAAASVVQAADRALEAARPSAERWLGALAPAAAADGDLDAVDRALTWARALRAAFDGQGLPADRRAAAWSAVVALATDATAPVDPRWATLAAAAEHWRAALTALREICGVELVGDDAHLDLLAARTAQWAAAAPALRDWAAYVRARAAAKLAGLDAAVAGVEAGTVAAAVIAPAWERAFHLGVAQTGIAASTILAEFHGAQHHAQVAAFVGLDRGQLGVARARAIAKLTERVPRVTADTADTADGGELGVLLHEVKKQRRHKPLRALFRAIPNLLPRLKPCLLMSPLSVAQYLDPAMGRFDLVVFDEASQIPTADAIGALARGDAAIIVGDSKQLPPTRFFEPGAGAAVADQPDDELEELESILDECVAARLPELRLTWHYRSRHEDLIAFSNDRYYGGTLDVFPAAAAHVPGLGVSWRKVDGVYDRAGARHNRAEAEAVVAEIVARLGDPERAAHSIGVVTFSRPQQDLILDLLDDARRANPALEPYFADDAAEPVLVKNLETIQGDERDVILFSIGYGPDRDGKVAMNFGPLNRAGGERRLNVAVTRAREQLIVFSTLEPEHLADDVAALGVRHLAELLRYARAGGQLASERAARAAATPVTRAIGDALVERGWTVHHQVGCAGYRIDLAVVDPDDPGRYVLGVEADGPAYARADTARDRDRLRPQVLGNLGWRLHRIWALDWFHDGDKELQRVHNAVIAAIASARAARKPGGAARSGPIAKVTLTPPSQPLRAKPPTPAPLAAPAAAAAATRGRTSSPPTAAIGRYVVAGIPAGRRKADELYELAREAELAKVIASVLAVEAPMHVELLARRVAAYFGIGQVTARVLERVRMVTVVGAQVGTPDDPDVVWRRDQDPTRLPTVRVPDQAAETRRDCAKVPLAEIAAAALVVLERNLGLPVDELVKETAKLLGFARQSDKVVTRMRAGVDALVARGGARLDDGHAALPDPSP